MDKLAGMLQAQRDLQIDSFGADPVRLEGEERVAFIRWNVDALQDELHEMMQEVGWKPWASSRHVNEKEAMAELVDAWHFFMNIMWAIGGRSVQASAGVLAGVLETSYHEKRKVNAQRQEDGYDGVAGKCPECKRDRAETSIEESLTSVAEPQKNYRMERCPCGHLYRLEGAAP